MGKQYQTSDSEASTLGLTIPEEVTVALAEIAHSATEGLLALSVGAGLQVMQTLMEQSGHPLLMTPSPFAVSVHYDGRWSASQVAGVRGLRHVAHSPSRRRSSAPRSRSGR